MTLLINPAHAAEAVSQMAEGLHEYNRGVLAMLGREQLAVNYRADHNQVTRLVEQRDALPETVFDSHTAEYERLSAEIDKASAVMASSWAPIQSLIDEARTLIATLPERVAP